MTSWDPSNTNNDKKDEYQVTAGESKIKLSEHDKSNPNSAVKQSKIVESAPNRTR
jgi:hypothetical protein